MHCMNKHGGFGDPHSAEPHGVEANTVKSYWADSDNDTALALNNFTDHCPELTEKATAFDEWIRKVAFLSLPMPSGLLAPGYVPKTSSLNHRREQHFWCEFIQKSHRKMHVGQC